MPKTVFTNCQSTNLDQLIGDKGLRVFNNGGHEVGKMDLNSIGRISIYPFLYLVFVRLNT
jgi:hypothetical protein